MNAKKFIWHVFFVPLVFTSTIVLARGGRVVGWGDNSHGQLDIPPTLTNATAVAAGYWHSVAVRVDGTVVAWGDNSSGQTNVPPGLSNVVAVACGLFHSLALQSDGKIVAWGDSTFGQANVPSGLSNVISIAAGDFISLALKQDGTVSGWGDQSAGEFNVPQGLTNIVAIGASLGEILLTGDGTVIYWGPSYQLSTSIGNIVGIAKSGNGLLRGDGTVVGSPAGISNVVTVSGYTTAIKSDGTVVEWDDHGTIVTNASTALTNVIAIGTGGAHVLGIVEDTLTIQFTSQLPLQTPYYGQTFRLYASAIGVAPLNYQWSFNGTNLPGATGPSLTLTNVRPVNDGNYSVIVSNQSGALTNSDTVLHTIIIPPIITSQSPADQLALLGTNITLSIVATGPLPTTYQWLFRGTNISDATNCSLTITNFQILNEGPYTAVVSNNFYAVTSASMSLTAGDLAGALNARLNWETSFFGPWFWQTSRSHDGIAVARSGPIGNGQSSVLGVTVDGPATLSFWMGIHASVFDTLTFTIDSVPQTYVYDGDPYGNQVWQHNTFYLPAGSQRLEWIFKRNATQGMGSEAGFLDEVSFIPGPTTPIISVAPTNQTVPATGNATFQVEATGTPPLTYQWQFNGTNISGATNTTLTLTSVQGSNGGLYSVVVSNPYGSNAPSASLTVIPVPPRILSQPASQRVPPNGNATFAVAATGSLPLKYQWQFNGNEIVGATNSSLALVGVQMTNAGNYQALITNDVDDTNSATAILTVSRLVAWGNNIRGQTTIPLALTNAKAVAGGFSHSLVLNFDGTVTAWGSNSDHETNVPTGLSNVVSIAAGAYHNLALRSDGTVVAWGAGTNTSGSLNFGQSKVPAGLIDVTAVGGGDYHSLVLRTNHTVLAWGANGSGQTNPPVNLSNIIAVAAGGYHNLALQSDGTLVAWGAGTNKGSPPNFGQSKVPSGLSNVVSVAAGEYHSMALRADGTMVAWGDNTYGQTNLPPGLTNVVAIGCGGYHSMALKSDGNLILWGNNAFGQTTAPVGLTNVIIAAGGFYHTLAVMNDGSPFIVRHPASQAIDAGADVLFTVGAVGIPDLHYQWRFNGNGISKATNAWLALTNVGVATSGSYECLVENSLDADVSSPAILAVLRTGLRFNLVSGNQMTSTGFKLQLDGLSGHGTIILYGSTNVLDWETVLTNAPTVGSLILIDSRATNLSRRFYRAAEE